MFRVYPYWQDSFVNSVCSLANLITLNNSTGDLKLWGKIVILPGRACIYPLSSLRLICCQHDSPPSVEWNLWLHILAKAHIPPGKLPRWATKVLWFQAKSFFSRRSMIWEYGRTPSKLKLFLRILTITMMYFLLWTHSVAARYLPRPTLTCSHNQFCFPFLYNKTPIYVRFGEALFLS